MQIDPELTKLLAQLIVRIVIEIGWIVIKHQRTQARDDRRRPARRKTTQGGTRPRRQTRLAARQKTATSEQVKEKESSE